MISAFGVEHGEISKGRVINPGKAVRPMRGMPKGKKPTAAQKRTAATAPAPNRKQRAQGMLHRIGEADISLKGVGGAAGTGAKGFGQFLQDRPGLAGTALVTGGSVGGYKLMTRGDKKKDR